MEIIKELDKESAAFLYYAYKSLMVCANNK